MQQQLVIAMQADTGGLEESLLVRVNPGRKAAKAGFDRTYEGLKR